MSDLDLPDDSDLVAVPDDSDLVPAELPPDEDLQPVEDFGYGGQTAEQARYMDTVEKPSFKLDIELAPLGIEVPKPVPDEDPAVSARFKARVGLSDPFAGTIARDRQQQLEREELVRSGFKAGSEEGVPPEVLDARVAKHFGIPLELVKPNREGWLDAYAKSSADPKRWIRENPLAARLVFEHPERADDVVSNKQQNVLLKGLNAVLDFATDTWDVALRAEQESAPILAKGRQLAGGVIAALNAPIIGKDKAQAEVDALLNPRTPEEQTAIEAERVKREAGTQVVESDSPEAAAIREQGALAIAAQRAKESRAGLEVSVLYSKLGAARGRGLNTEVLEAEIRDAESRAKGLALGETGWTQALADSWAQSQSSLDVLENVVDRGGKAAAIGLVVGGGIGAAATKTPQGAFAGAVRGASLGAKVGGAEGAAERSFTLEFGDSYKQLLTMPTSTGEHLTEPEARGGALIAASVKTGWELAELSLILKALGPGAAIFEKGGIEAVKAQLASNPGLRALAVRAAKAWAGEGVEEVAQGVTDDVVTFLTKSKHMGRIEEGPVVDVEARKQDFTMGLLGGLPIGAGSFAIAAGTHAVFKEKEERGAMQGAEIAKLAADPTSAAMGGELGDLITKKSAETGFPVTHVYFEAAAFKTFFQTSDEANAGAEQVLGESGAQKLVEAEASGGRVAVPVGEFIERAGKVPGLAEHLSKQLATSFEGHSQAQLEEQKKADEAWAKSIADEARKEGASPTLDRFDALEQQLQATGKMTKAEARDALQPMRDTFHGFAKKFGQSAEDLFRNVRINVDDGAAKLLVEYKKANASHILSEQLNSGKLDANGRAEVLYVDDITDLHTFEGFEQMQEEAPAESVISLTLTDIKPVNDDVKGGHGVSDALLRHVAPAIAGVDPIAARKGTNFILRGGPVELERALKDVHARLPKGMHAVGAVGPNALSAIEAMDKKVDEGRASGALPKERADSHADMKKLPQIEAAMAKAQEVRAKEKRTHRVKVTTAQVAKAGVMEPGEFFKHAYQDKVIPGVLSHTGWDNVPRKAFVASIDIKGLKAINALGKEVGDKVLQLFAEVVRDFDGSDFDFAHLSGDEYAAQHDSQEKLQAWLDRVEVELTKRSVPYTITGPDGQTRTEPVAARFRAGIGEKSYGNADRVLNAAKLEEKRLEAERAKLAEEQRVLEGVRGTAAGERSGTAGAPGGVRAEAPGGKVQAGQGKRLHEPRGAAPQQYIAPGQAQAAAVAGKTLEQDTNGFTNVAISGIEKVFRIGLTAKANKSTFLHESAHVFLEVFGDLAARADAPAAVVADWQTTLAWLGAKDGASITTDQHEKWAKAFEHYLAKGEYPAVRLAGAFRRFRLWMGTVYRQLTQLGDVSPEIKGVFDRLLATDEEIAAQKEGMRLKALPMDVLGMDIQEYSEHLDQLVEATSHARELADFEVAKDELRTTESWWKQAHQEAKQEAAAEYEGLSARVAQRLLDGEIAAGLAQGAPISLNRAEVEGWLGKDRAKSFRLSADGVHADDVLEAYPELKYETGRDLVEAIRALPSKEDFVDARADQLMVERHPGVLDERTKLREVVSKGLHGDKTKAWALKEWAALNARGTKESPKTPPAAILRRAAELMVLGRTARELDVHSAQVAERKAANDAQKAALRGDYAQAAAFKQKQLLNMYLHDALREAKKEVESFETFAQKLGTLKARQRLGKGHPTYRNAVDHLLSTFGLAEAPQGLQGSLDALLAESERLMTENADTVAFDRERIVDRAKVATVGPVWKALALEDLRHVRRALENLQAAARNRATVLQDGRRLDKEMTIEQLQLEGEQLARRPDEPTTEAETFGQAVSRRWNQFDGGLLKVETMARWLSGEKDTAGFIKSTWFKAIVEPMQKAKTREIDLFRDHVAPVVKAFEAIPEETQARWMDRFDGKKYFSNHVAEKLPQRRFEVLMMLLNSGNESNLQRVTEGRGITEQEIRAAAEAVNVTKEEYAWLQSIWDAAESLKPLAFDLEEQDSGVRPDSIPARAFDTPHGRVKGGYFPAVYDRVAAAGKKQEASLAGFVDPSYTRPATSHSFLKKRVDGFSDIISLSPASIQRHFTQVVHDVSHRQAIKSVGTLLLDQRVQKLLRERLGSGRAEQFTEWVGDVARQRGASMSSSPGLRFLSELASKVRGNIITAALGYKVPNAAEDFTSNLLSAVPASDLKAKHLAGAAHEFISAPIETRRFVLKKSGELRARQDQVQRELAKQLRNLTETGIGKALNQGPVGWYKDHAFAFAEGVEVLTGTTIWLGAYRQAEQQGSTDTEAVTFADATVRQVMVSHSAVDLSTIMRDKGVIGHMLMFHGAFNHFYNQFRSLQAQGRGGDSGKLIVVKSAKALALSVSLFLIGSLARGQGPEKDEPYAEWILRKMALEGFMQLVPGAGVVGNTLASSMRGKMTSTRNNSLFGVAGNMTDSVLKAAKSDDPKTKVKAALQVLGPATGVPTSAPLQVGEPLWDWINAE